MMWHQFCWTNEYKERQQGKKQRVDAVSYNAPADVKPDYYRVAEVADPPSSSGSSQAAPAAAAPQGCFCSQCGKKADGGAKFCSGCGNKLN
mmetsp:Transcript_21527/g.27386  ORF Transcript_21527/g.27386 Transcript_21527/m.27386 type:complete len:91 (-) Transcript_21527:10-282(-)